MEFHGQSLSATALGGSGVYEVCFDRKGESINKLDDRTVGELRDAIRWLASQTDLRGVLVTSQKDVFIVGADIAEFGKKFTKTTAEIAADLAANSKVFTEFEDLPVPSVVAINGYALGGGLEMALAASFRVMAEAAQIGVPEVKLGIFPGYGGTVRLARVAGPAVAAEWVTTGITISSARALSAGVVDAVADPSSLRDVALDWLERAIAGEVDWRERQRRKLAPVALAANEVTAIFDAARANLPDERHQPAAGMALSMMEQAAGLDRDLALALEAEVFGHVAHTQAARSMTQVFLDEQGVRKLARRHAAGARPVREVALLGAGTMGRGIAFASASAGVPIHISDISQQTLEHGIGFVRAQVERQVTSGRLNRAEADDVLDAILPTLGEGPLTSCDMVVEAIDESLEAKQAALARVEEGLQEDAILATNTSSLRLADIGKPLARPHNLVGMHFFNPVHSMQLVEVVRGTSTSSDAVAMAAAYAIAIGKTPIVVADCPGFLVNRLFTSYICGFLQLVEDGADFELVDRAMESFGWPMGPACLEDLIGIDIGSRVNNVISSGYPARMPPLADDALQRLAQAGRFGRKTGVGFYRYEVDVRGKLQRSPAPDTHDLLASLVVGQGQSFSEPEIVDRMLLPMVIEASIALEEEIVGSPAELDAAIRMGLGFPLYAGGPLMYADWLGMQQVVSRCEQLRHLGTAYAPSKRMLTMADAGASFHFR